MLKPGFLESNVDCFEKQCIEIIDENLDIFFNACRKSAFVYAMMVSKDLKGFNIEEFENMVISNEELNNYIAVIINRLNKEIEMHFDCRGSLEKNCCYMEALLDSQRNLKETIEKFKITQNITKGCEKIMRTAFNKTLKSLCPHKPVHIAAKRFNIGEKILGENSSTGQIDSYQKEIYNQIQGMLVNIRIEIKAYLVEEFYRSINFIIQSNKRINNIWIA